jgi:SPP1 family predicted phage head-tail adaptor
VKLSGKMINPGELRTPITLYPRTITVGAGGFQIVAEGAGVDVWARWVNAHGYAAEVMMAQSGQATAPASVLIRYRAGVDTTWRVEMGGELYEVVSVDDIQARHEYIELKVKLWRPG